jgi:hypothetical protein
MPKSDWLNAFVEKNAWGIIAFIVLFVISYTTLSEKIKAQTERIDRMESTQQIMAENQRDIIILQEREKATTEMIQIIKEDIKDIKKALNIH